MYQELGYEYAYKPRGGRLGDIESGLVNVAVY